MRSAADIIYANLASAHPLTRLKAAHELAEVKRKEFEETVDRVELEQVRAARRQPRPASWAEIGRALGVSHTQARRRFAERLDDDREPG